jgi:hypothetical protein
VSARRLPQQRCVQMPLRQQAECIARGWQSREVADAGRAMLAHARFCADG